MPVSLHSAAFPDLDARTLYALVRLRVDVFVVEQACAYPELDGRDDEPGTLHVWAGDRDLVVGYLRLLTEADGMRRIGRVCVAADRRREGLAARLVEEALRLCASDPVFLHAQSHVTAWYERFDFVVDGAEFVVDGIPHVRMRRAS